MDFRRQGHIVARPRKVSQQEGAWESRADRNQTPGEPGIWFFVGGDLIVFSVFFVLIVLQKKFDPQMFALSQATLDLRIGVWNTLLLLTGSWFVATGVERYRMASVPREGSWFFLLAILCGLGFVVNKAVEWSGKVGAGITPETNDFYMLFFVFTGIHLLHVLVGLVVLFCVFKASRQTAIDHRGTRVMESGGIFWHLVDLLWVVLFALFYLL